MDSPKNCGGCCKMNIEQRIKEIEEFLNRNHIHLKIGVNYRTQEEEIGFARGKAQGYAEMLQIIKHLQSEVERYKHLWETDSAQSKEIIAELKFEVECQKAKQKELVKELKAVDEWQDISSAPRDIDIDILVYRDEDKTIHLEHANNSKFYEMNGFTRWKPLPKPPKQND